jgi:SAM-dependent methyltransferase
MSPDSELMDRPLPWAENRRALADLDRVTRLLLGLRSVVRTLGPRLAAGPPHQLLVDLGTGSGLAAAALERHAARAGRRVRVVGVDSKLVHLLLGRRWGRRQLRIVAEAAALPLRDGAADWALSTLLFHHFDRDENRRILAEMRRVARRGAAVVDLRRSRWSSLLVRLLLPLVGAGRVARHDGRLSVDRAWTLAEVERLVAGGPVLELRRRFPFRFSLLLAGRDGDSAR